MSLVRCIFCGLICAVCNTRNYCICQSKNNGNSFHRTLHRLDDAGLPFVFCIPLFVALTIYSLPIGTPPLRPGSASPINTCFIVFCCCLLPSEKLYDFVSVVKYFKPLPLTESKDAIARS